MKISIYENMFLNQQSVSVQINLSFQDYFKNHFQIADVKLHAGNVYLFAIPLAGEFTELNLKQKQFIFEKELSLYEEQYEIKIEFSNTLFERFFEITWHGVVYHGEIKTL